MARRHRQMADCLVGPPEDFGRKLTRITSWSSGEKNEAAYGIAHIDRLDFLARFAPPPPPPSFFSFLITVTFLFSLRGFFNHFFSTSY